MAVREIRDDEWPWLLETSRQMGGPKMLSGGFLHDLKDYPALVSEENRALNGFLVYRMGDVSCHILGILSTEPRNGVGSELLVAVEQLAQNAGKSRVRISATNDNLPALRFLQLRGYILRQLIPGAFLEVKKLKGLPAGKPVEGIHGIEIRDEVILNHDL